jgi:hypothetical protein
MEKKHFEILLERIRIGSYPPMLGHTITVDQFLEIQSMCGSLANQVPIGDENGMTLVTEYLLNCKCKVDDFGEMERRLADSLKGNLGLFESIKKLINAYQTDDTKDSIFIVHGDSANKKAHFQIYGNVQDSAMAFAALLHSDKSDLKRFILSVVGAYLAKNPKDEKMFLRGIDEVKKYTPGIN